MATFLETIQPTPFGLYDTDTQFISEADRVVVFVKRMLGDDVLQVELTKKQIWSCFERATSAWGALINQYQAKSHLTSYLGTSGSTDISNLYPRNTLEFVLRQAEPYAINANLGGTYTHVLGRLPLRTGTQDYNLHTELLDPSNNIIFDNQVVKQRLRVMDVFHFSPTTAYRFFDSTSAINYLNNEFSFESFTPETIFYVLPVFEDILRAGQMEASFRVRRSHYSYQILGNGYLRLMPLPTRDPAGNLFVRVAYAQHPTAEGGAYLMSGSVPNTSQDPTTNGVSSLSDIPYGIIPYSSINQIGRQWIKEMTLAYSKELLGIVRTKVSEIPIPGASVQLNGEALKSEARDDMEKLKEQITALLEDTTYDKLLEKDAAKADNLLKMLRMVPNPGGSIMMG
jgi:hypothetical protein